MTTMDDPYRAPQAEVLETDANAEADYYVVAPFKFLLLLIGTFGLYWSIGSIDTGARSIAVEAATCRYCGRCSRCSSPTHCLPRSQRRSSAGSLPMLLLPV